jgi:hypothetical protein
MLQAAKEDPSSILLSCVSSILLIQWAKASGGMKLLRNRVWSLFLGLKVDSSMFKLRVLPLWHTLSERFKAWGAFSFALPVIIMIPSVE